MATKGFLGEYNNIYFLTEDGRISALCDRAHRKRPVCFAEEEIDDLAEEPRESAKLFIGSTLPDWLPEDKSRFPDRQDTRTIEVAGRHLTVTGQAHILEPVGFGLGLKYQVIAPERERAAALLTVKLPEKVRYRVHWEPITREGSRFTLPENMVLTVLTNLPWRFESSTFIVETESEEGEVTFLVESLFAPSRVQETVILTVDRRERDAILARVACGRGFVPCFVLNASQDIDTETLRALLGEIPHRLLLNIGLTSARALAESDIRVVEVNSQVDSSAEVAALLGEEPLSQTLIAPDCQEAYGPALFLALRYKANLRFDEALGDQLHLENADGCHIHKWLLSDLLGIPLDMPTDSEESISLEGGKEEVVICESTAADLLVCQAVGYAELRGCPIAFLPPIAQNITADGFPNGATGLRVLEVETAKAVPIILRAPNADTLTIFTLRLPLHLTPLPTAEPDTPGLHWMDRYTLAHLPGQVASQLVPRYFRERLQEAPPAPFAVIFDAIGQVTDTEGQIYAEELTRGLSHPIALPKWAAQREVLREILRRLDTDLILLITHGGRDYIEDGVGDVIPSAEIMAWTLRGSPLVFNNSCTSWTTTGQAFLSAGALGFIGSLWPIANDIAAEIAAWIGAQLHAKEEDDVPTLLRDAVREVTAARPKARETAAAYLYVGLPGTQLLTRPAINTEETVALLAETFQALYNVLGEIAVEGRPDVAVVVQQAVSESLRKRFKALLVPGELPPQLPFPMAQYSALDIDFLLASANFNFGKAILSRLSHEHQRNIVARMDEYLHQALHELVTWDDRHDTHLGRTKTERATASQQAGMPVGPMGERGFYDLAAKMVLNDILPFVSILTDLYEEDSARSWLNIASKMVTTQTDLSPDGSVTDEALIRRIREGVREQMRVLSFNEGRSETETWIGHLETAVNKSELANRFGIACLHLKDNDRAAAFFEAACNLAEPGSNFYANAVSNLSNALRQLKRFDEALDGYQRAFVEQEQLHDYRNAMVTAANMLRVAAQIRQVIDETIITKALMWANALTVPSNRIKHRCDLLGASACYYASRGRHEQATAVCEEISRHLQDPFPVPEVAVHLSELVEWYYKADCYPEAAKQAFVSASYFKAAHMLDAATREYIFAGECALQAYSVSHNKRYISMFLDCSEQIGRILRPHPNLRAELGDFAETAWENTQSIWRQLADQGERVLALQAYESVKAWDPKREDPAWERLAYAYHPRNREAIQALAMSGSLLREATVTIDAEMQVAVEVTTRREDATVDYVTLFPEIVYGYLPLYDPAKTSPGDGTEVVFVGGAAVYTLRDGKSVTVREEDVQVLRTDGRGTFLYQEVWGSRIIPYRVVISLAPGLIPLEMECESRFNPAPKRNIRFDSRGCRIVLETETNDEHMNRGLPWLAEICLIFRNVPELGAIFSNPAGPFTSEMPFELYSVLLHLLGSMD